MSLSDRKSRLLLEKLVRGFLSLRRLDSRASKTDKNRRLTVLLAALDGMVRVALNKLQGNPHASRKVRLPGFLT